MTKISLPLIWSEVHKAIILPVLHLRSALLFVSPFWHFSISSISLILPSACQLALSRVIPVIFPVWAGQPRTCSFLLLMMILPDSGIPEPGNKSDLFPMSQVNSTITFISHLKLPFRKHPNNKMWKDHSTVWPPMDFMLQQELWKKSRYGMSNFLLRLTFRDLRTQSHLSRLPDNHKTEVTKVSYPSWLILTVVSFSFIQQKIIYIAAQKKESSASLIFKIL